MEHTSLIVVPVLDVMQGVTVHAIAGDRAAYQPLRTVVSQTSDPLDVARGLAARHYPCAYLADLDALQGRQVQWRVIADVATCFRDNMA